MYLVKSHWLLKKLYPGLTWDIEADKPCIYLTFDDGPIPIVTPFVLNILKQYNAKATFFCIGDNANRYADIFDRVKNDGHSIGNHTYNHLKGWRTEDDIYLQNTLKADCLLHSRLFRPPYGRIKKSQVKLLQNAMPGINIIMWDVLSGDFDLSLRPEKCLDNVLKHTQSGSIVVFHDSFKAFARLKYALPAAMEVWSKAGYSFKAIT
jgi:peptidoglycan/xylan/chitin deacetylase (PgdA/CDA1 family)